MIKLNAFLVFLFISCISQVFAQDFYDEDDGEAPESKSYPDSYEEPSREEFQGELEANMKNKVREQMNESTEEELDNSFESNEPVAYPSSTDEDQIGLPPGSTLQPEVDYPED